jgi:sugar lactone lactonase YvrE
LIQFSDLELLMKRVFSLSPHRALRALAAFCPPGRTLLKTTLCGVLATAGIVAPALRAQTTASFVGARANLGHGLISPEGVAVDKAGDVFVGDGFTGLVSEIVAGTGGNASGVVSSSSTVNVVGSGFSDPIGVAVDGAGDVFVADDGSNTVSEIVAGSGGNASGVVSSSSTVNVVGSFSDPVGVAVDAAGNVFVAVGFTGQNGVVSEIVAGTGGNAPGVVSTSSTVNIIVAVAPSSFSNPRGVAVDAAGDVFVADSFSGAVSEIVAGTGGNAPGVVSSSSTVNVVGNLDQPVAVAVDGAGDVFVTVDDNHTVVEIVAGSGGNAPGIVSPSSTVSLVAEGFNEPLGLAVNGAGNVFVADEESTAVDEVLRNRASFGSTPIAASTPAQFTVAFIFSADNVLIGAPVVVSQGATGQDFTDAGTGTCTPAENPFFPGETCTVNVNFTPKSPGLRYGGVQLTNSVGAVIATAEISAIGVAPQVNFVPGIQSVVGSLSNQTTPAQPAGVAIDAGGTLYVSDAANKQVVKLPPTGAATIVANSATNGLGLPAGVAVDGLGNVYIADSGNNQVLLETLSGTSYTQTVLMSGLGAPKGVAVDGNGNVYIADTTNNQVLLETLSNGTYTQSLVVNGLNAPAGVAVDGNGNVYIADTGNNRIVEEVLSGGVYSQSVLFSTGLNQPQGVSLDGMGNIYISNTGSSSVLEETLENGGYLQTMLGSGLNLPEATTIGGNGDVYIADTMNNQVVKLDVSDAPSLAFKPTVVGSTSSDSPQTVTVANVGNAPLSIVAPADGNNPSIAANFTLDSTGGTACPVANSASAAATLAAGVSCTLPISFAPTAVDSFSGSLELTDNNLNAVAPTFVSQSITLSGTGIAAVVAPAKTTPTITWAAPASIAYGTALSATQLDATANVPGTFVYNPAAGTVLGAGVQTLTVTFTPNDTTDYTTATTTVSLTVGAQGVPVLAFAPIATQAEGAAPFAVSATSASNGAVTYAVVTGPATIAGNLVTVTGVGTVALIANQAASGSYAAATATTTFTVGLPFTLTTATGTTAGSTGTTASVAPGAAASFSFTLTPAGSTFPDAITFTATGLPTGATSSFSPATIAAGSKVTPVTLTIQTANTTTTARNEQPFSGNPLAPVALGFLLLPLLGVKAARERLRQMPRLPAVLLAVGLTLGAVLGISGCSGGGATPPAATTTPAAQSYTVVVTAMDSVTKAQSTTNLTLTVQ